VSEGPTATDRSERNPLEDYTGRTTMYDKPSPDLRRSVGRSLPRRAGMADVEGESALNVAHRGATPHARL